MHENIRSLSQHKTIANSQRQHKIELLILHRKVKKMLKNRALN